VKLLSVGTNAKTIKSDKQGEYLTAILYLAPALTSGIVNVCPKATAGCKASCLFTAGRGVYHNVQAARVRKTLLFIQNRQEFLLQLVDDLTKFINKCNKLDVKPAVRLNGTSDIAWENISPPFSRLNVLELFPNIQFYDYTKIHKRLFNILPNNYHLTFSRSETNEVECKQALQLKTNVAVVFKDKLPKKYWDVRVINGDLTDLRFLDAKSVIVGLKAKGRAKKDTTGFVIRKD
jgi:hypothetical protein